MNALPTQRRRATLLLLALSLMFGVALESQGQTRSRKKRTTTASSRRRATRTRSTPPNTSTTVLRPIGGTVIGDRNIDAETPAGTGGGGGTGSGVAVNDDIPPAPMPTPRPPKPGMTVSGGVLNGKAISKPQPPYPPIAKAAGASGTVTVQITVNEEGNVISANAVSGHPLLRQAAVSAARQAKFSPTRLSGQLVRVTGVVTYNFVLP